MLRIGFLFILCVCSVYPQTYYINIHLKEGGGTHSFAIQNSTKIMLSGDSLSILSVKGLAAAIKTFALLQNYPNPFNPSTTIQYDIPRVGAVDIRIFDINGRLVRTFSSQRDEPGSHSVLWNGHNGSGQSVASGVYFYQVQFDNSVLTRRMLLLK